MRCAPSELAVRTATRQLLPGADPVAVLASEAQTADWRLLELYSRTGEPFDVALSWTSAGPAAARLTVPVATRVCVYARSVAVHARTLGKRPNEIVLQAIDAHERTRNTYEVIVDDFTPGPMTVDAEVPVPPFARTVRLDRARPGGPAGGLPPELVLLRAGRAVASVRADRQPDGGVPLGSASRIRVQQPLNVAQPFRLVFALAL